MFWIIIFQRDSHKCNWLSLAQRVMAYKILHSLCPANRRYKVIERSMISEYGARNDRDLQIPKVRLGYAKRSFYFSDVKNCSEIPIVVVFWKTSWRVSSEPSRHILDPLVEFRPFIVIKYIYFAQTFCSCLNIKWNESSCMRRLTVYNRL